MSSKAPANPERLDDYNPMATPRFAALVRESSDALRRGTDKRRLSIHDALSDWQAGGISEEMALALTGSTSRRELYAHCLSCDVAIADRLSDDEMRAVEALRRELSAG